MDIPEMHSTDTVREQTAKLHDMNKATREAEAVSQANSGKRVIRDILVGLAGFALQSTHVNELVTKIIPAHSESINQSLDVLGYSTIVVAIGLLAVEAVSKYEYTHRKPYVSMFAEDQPNPPTSPHRK